MPPGERWVRPAPVRLASTEENLVNPDPTFPFREALAALQSRLPRPPDLLMVLGSGLNGLAEGISGSVSIPFQEVPGFPRTGVSGHAGCLVFGELEGRAVLIQKGRFHFYEGHRAELVVAPIRLAAALGALSVILTNAAGGIARGLDPGAILLLDDHLNLMGRGAVAGPVRGVKARFPEMSDLYDQTLQARALAVADALGIPLTRGVYAGVLGPSYETPAEIRFLEKAGAHAVGMSTVPEAITAAALGLRVLGLSLITNRAAGSSDGPLDHQEVLEVGREAGGRLERLLRGVIPAMPGRVD